MKPISNPPQPKHQRFKPVPGKQYRLRILLYPTTSYPRHYLQASSSDEGFSGVAGGIERIDQMLQQPGCHELTTISAETSMSPLDISRESGTEELLTKAFPVAHVNYHTGGIGKGRSIVANLLKTDPHTPIPIRYHNHPDPKQRTKTFMRTPQEIFDISQPKDKSP